MFVSMPKVATVRETRQASVKEHPRTINGQGFIIRTNITLGAVLAQLQPEYRKMPAMKFAASYHTPEGSLICKLGPNREAAIKRVLRQLAK